MRPYWGGRCKADASKEWRTFSEFAPSNSGMTRNAELRAISCALTLALVPGVARAQTKEFSRTVTLDAGGEVRLEASKGSVRLTAWDRNEVEVQARIEASNTSWISDGDYSRRAVEATTVDVAAGSRSVSIRSNYDAIPTRWHWLGGVSRETPSIHYTIRAPAKADLRLDLDRSDTELAGFQGRMMLDLDRSELDGRNLRGTIDVTIDRGGQSRLTNVRGAVMLDADRTDVRIDADQLDSASRIRADRGEIELMIPSSQRLSVRADLARRGTFHSDFPMTRPGRDDSDIEGTINGGGPELQVRGDRVTFLLRRR
jgi:hypothetical protein